MRILVPTTWFPSVDDPVSGVFVRRHVEALAQAHDVDVLALLPQGAEPLPPPPSLPRLHVHHVAMTLSDPSAVVRAARSVRRYRVAIAPDVVHSMAFSSIPFGAAAGGPAWVHTEHWSGVTHPDSAGLVWSMARGARHGLRLPERVTVVSNDMADKVRRFTRPDSVDVIGNVVEQVEPLSPRDRSAIRLLGVGGLTETKSPLLALRTVAILRNSGHDARLRWAGTGPLADEVRSVADLLGISSYVELLGLVPPSKIGLHFEWSTSLLLPTKHETFCVAAAESLAHGRPVVIGAQGGQRDFVTMEVGRLVDSRNPEVWAQAVLETHDRLAETPEAALAAAVQQYRPQSIAAKFGEVYARATRGLLR